VAAIEANLARARQEAEQHHKAAAIRVRRIHEHIHRRLAVYRRALIRAHPHGAWVNEVLSVVAPEIPGWALPDAYLPEDPPQPPAPPDDIEILDPGSAEAQTRVIELTHEVTRFGSDPDGTDDAVGYEVLEAPIAAPWHFTIVKVAGLLELRDRGCGHGPYVNGAPVSGTVTFGPGEFFDFANRRYTMLDADHLEDALLGECRLIAASLSATSGSKVRLSDMSFVQREKTLLAILGPSGAGKSSLFSALLGELPLESGRLFFQGLSMATHAKQIRGTIGFVPQKTELHETMTVEATLRFGFDLRSPGGKKGQEKAIERAIAVNKLEKQRHQLLSTLSGGQLRRVSIALELLTEPALLMLDEPTSGLDASMDLQIMTFLRKHAEEDDGHTVIVVTHATEHLYLAHRILVVAGEGAPAYFGPPRDLRRHFRFERYAELLTKLLDGPEEWIRKYRAGQAAREAAREADNLEQEIAATRPETGQTRRSRRSHLPRGAGRILRVLFLRQWVLIGSRGLTKNVGDRSPRDRFKNCLVVLLPLIIAAGSAALAAGVSGVPGLGPPRSLPEVQAGPTALALLTTLSVLAGQALTYSDVVEELGMIRREFRAGVGAFPVLATKWLVYAVIAVTQAALITTVFCAVPHLAPQHGILFGPEVDLFLSLAALSVAAMTLGLFISTLAVKLAQAVALVTLTSIVQIALNGITSDLSGTGLGVVACIFPSRWGVAAAASSIDLRGINASYPGQVFPDALWSHTAGQWYLDLAALGLLTVVFFGMAAARLHARLRLPGPARRWKGIVPVRPARPVHRPVRASD
jgi:ABC-type multidrug transport system ATPase subunit